MSTLSNLLRKRPKPGEEFSAQNQFTDPIVTVEDQENKIPVDEIMEAEDIDEVLDRVSSDIEVDSVLEDVQEVEPVAEFQNEPEPEPEPTPEQVVTPVVEYKPTEDAVEVRAAVPAEAYSTVLEHMILDIMAKLEVKNIAISTFGPQAKSYVPTTLSLIKFGEHTFVGVPHTDADRLNSFFVLEDMIREKEKEQADAVMAVKLVKSYICDGVVYKNLLWTEQELSLYSQATGRKVACNSTSSEDDLRVVVYGRNNR